MWETDFGGESKTQDLKEHERPVSRLRSLWQTSDCVPLCAFPSPLDAVAAIKMFASGLRACFLIPREFCRLFSLPLHVGDLRCDDANSHHDVSPPLVFTSGL